MSSGAVGLLLLLFRMYVAFVEGESVGRPELGGSIGDQTVVMA